MPKLIRGKVARVLNSREIVINAGSADGVTVGMDFNVIDPNGEDIRDPDTDEVLGSLDLPKIRVQVTYVQENLSVATTSQAAQVNRDSMADSTSSAGSKVLGPYAKFLMPPGWVARYERSGKIETSANVLNTENRKVEIGDPVVQVIEKEA